MSKKRIFLTLEQRMEVIELKESGTSERKLAKVFNCSKSQINKIVKEKELIWKEWETFIFRGIRRVRRAKYSNLNEAVLEWFKIAKSINIPINSTMIKQKAIEIAGELGIENFSASNGWLDKFRIRHNIVFRALNDGAADIQQDLYDDWITRIPLILAAYEDRDIYNMNETCLLFRALPTKSMVSKLDESKGGNIAEDHLTIAFCVNALGEKEKPLVIWKSLNPICCKDKNISSLGVDYKVNRKARMTLCIFLEWLINFDVRMSSQKRKILLILHSAPCHVVGMKLRNIQLFYLPKNTMANLQPLDHGVVKCFKSRYRLSVLQSIIARMDESHTAAELAGTITVFDAIQWITAVWHDINPDVIKHYFASCRMTNSKFEQRSNPFDETDVVHMDEIIQLSKRAGIEYDQSLLEYEENIECFDELDENCETRTRENFLQANDLDSEDGPAIKVQNYVEISKPIISAEQTLNAIDELMIHSECMVDEHLSTMFSEIKLAIEEKLASGNFKHTNVTNI